MSYEELTHEERVEALLVLLNHYVRSNYHEYDPDLKNEALPFSIGNNANALIAIDQATYEVTEETDTYRVGLLKKVMLDAFIAIDRIGLGCY